MLQIDRIVSVTEAKNHLLDFVRNLAVRGETVAITRDGVPAAVLMSIEHFEGLIETIAILSDPKVMKSLRKSMKQATEGKWVEPEAVFSRRDS